MARILFIDDDRKVHDLVCAALEQNGYQVNRNWDSTISCVPQQADAAARKRVRAEFLIVLLRAFAAWST